MIRGVVVDDEPLAVQRLVRLLRASRRVQVVESTTDPAAALQFLRTATIDILSLDVSMPGLSGFDLLRALERPVPVIFTTAFDRYALEAFAEHSIDYLLKPIDEARLARALDKFERLTTTGTVDIPALARQLAAQLATRAPARIPSRLGERTIVLEVARITHFVAKDRLTYAVSEGKEHVVDPTLATLDAGAGRSPVRTDSPGHHRERLCDQRDRPVGRRRVGAPARK